MLGLDVETSALDDRGPRFFAPAFTVRLVQFGTEREAWVLDMADPGQRDAAAAVLADPARRFVTHTSFDVLAVWVTLGIPLGQRVADTHLLSKLSTPMSAPGTGSRNCAPGTWTAGWPTLRQRCTRGCGRWPRPGTGPGTRRCGGGGTTCPPTMRHT